MAQPIDRAPLIAGPAWNSDGTIKEVWARWFLKVSAAVPSFGGVNLQTGRSYTVQLSDQAKLVSFSNASSVAVSLPGSGTLESDFFCAIENRGAGRVTIDPATGLIDGAATLALTANQGCWLFFDGTNWYTERGIGAGGGPVIPPVTFQTNGVTNTLQTKENLIAGSGVLLTPDALGGTTIALQLFNTPTIRGSGITDAVANSITIAFPAGSTAGDMAVLFTANAWPATNPAGWTNLYIDSTLTWMSLGAWKILTAGDIATGSVTVGFTNAFSCKAAITVFIGPTGGIREFQEQHGAGGGLVITNNTTGAVLNTDAGIYFASVRGNVALPTITPGVTLQTSVVNDGTRLSDQSMPGGVTSVVSSFGLAGAGAIAAQVIVMGVPSGIGTVTSVTASSPLASTGGINPNISLTGIIPRANLPGPATPTIRGTAAQASSNNTFTVAWPAGTLAGDLAVILAGGGFAFTAPTGWTTLDNSAGANWNGAIFTRVLSTADIATGNVAVVAAGVFDAAVAIITFAGGTGGTRTATALRSGAGAAASTLIYLDGSPLTTDMAVYFGSNRGASVDTVSLGVLLRQVNDGVAGSGCLYAGSPAALGGVSPVFSYSVAGAGFYEGIVIVRGL